MFPKTMVLIGCGGIGFHLAPSLARIGSVWANKNEESARLVLIDGDLITKKNLVRQFSKASLGMPKCQALRAELDAQFSSENFDVVAIEDYVNRQSLRLHKKEWFKDGVMIFTGLDNNQSRVFIEKEALKLPNVTIIAGGNETLQGQAQLWVRRKRKDVTPKITEISPEIMAEAGEPLPSTDHCLEESLEDPQTAQVNRAVALAMELLFLNQVVEKNGDVPDKNEVRVDIQKPWMGAFWRDPIPVKGGTR